MKNKEIRYVHLKDPRVKDILSKDGILYVNLDFKGFGQEVTKIDAETYKEIIVKQIEEIESLKKDKGKNKDEDNIENRETSTEGDTSQE